MNLVRSAGGAVQLRLQGEAGTNYVVQASPDLENWLTLPGKTATNGVVDFSDPNAVNFAGLFYRARTAEPTEVPNPVAVTVALDTNHTASALISVSGGRLDLTSSDGAIYRLSIPTNALLSEEVISMTLIRSVNGLPLSGGLMGAVQLAPEGLTLWVSATLTIEFPNAIPTNLITSFSHHGDGREFHLIPEEVNGRTVTYRLWHFSGLGSGQATDGDRQAQQQRHPTDPRDAMEQRVRAVLQGSRDRGEVTPEDQDKLEVIFREYFNATVLPMLKIAENNCPTARAAIRGLLMWHRDTLLLGLEDRFARELQQGRASLGPIYRNCARELHERCLKEHNLSVIRDMLSLAREVSLLGDWIPDAGVLSYLEAQAMKCLRFEIDFESVIENSRDGVTFLSHVRASRIQIYSQDLLTDLVNGLKGEGPLDYLSFTITDAANPDCTYQISTKGSALHANLRFNLNSKADDKAELSLALGPGSPTEAWTILCPQMEPATVPIAVMWSGYFVGAHMDEMRAGIGDFVIKDWTIQNQQLFARKSYQRAVIITAGGASEPITETTTLGLWHVPQP